MHRGMHRIIRREIERRNLFHDDTGGNRFVDRLAKLLGEATTTWGLIRN